MKLILVSTFLIVGAVSAKKQSAQSAGLRGQHKVEGGGNEQRELQSILFGGSSGGFSGAGGTDLLFQCTDACSDQAACSSFMMAFNPTSLYEDACNTGCFPQAKLQTCQQMCQQNVSEPWEEDGAPTPPAAVAVARLGFFDSAVEMMCSDCKFYECCSASSSADEGVVTSPAKRSTKYESCMVHLPESLDDQAFGDSVLDQIAASLGDALSTVAESFEESIPGGLNITQALDAAMGGGTTNDFDLDSVVDQLVDTASEAIDSITQALDLPEWNMTDPQATQEWLDNLDWNAILESFGLSDMFEDLQTMLNDTMADFNAMSVSCDANNCPIDGLCDMSVDMASLDVDDICKNDAFFQCGGGLQQMCLDECSGDTDGFAPLCSLCNVATCCQEKEFGDDTTFEKCVSASVPEDLVQADSSETTKDSPVEDSTSRLNGGPSDGLQFGSSASSLGAPVEAESDILQSEATPADDADLLNSAIGPVESNTLEVSGSSVSATRLYVSLAAIATLMFASL